MDSAILPGHTAAYHALLVTLLCGGAWGCRETTGESPRTFPDNFIFGASMAGFQVDPGCPTLAAEDCEDRASDWYQWVTDEDLIADSSTYLSGDALSNGPGHWELYQEDFLRAAEDQALAPVGKVLAEARSLPNDDNPAIKRRQQPPPQLCRIDDTISRNEDTALEARPDAVGVQRVSRSDSNSALVARPSTDQLDRTLPLAPLFGRE